MKACQQWALARREQGSNVCTLKSICASTWSWSPTPLLVNCSSLLEKKHGLHWEVYRSCIPSKARIPKVYQSGPNNKCIFRRKIKFLIQFLVYIAGQDCFSFSVLTEVETHSFPGDKSTPGTGLQQILTAKQSNGCSHGSVQDLNVCLGHCLDSPGMTVPWVTVEFDGRHYFLEHLM